MPSRTLADRLAALRSGTPRSPRRVPHPPGAEALADALHGRVIATGCGDVVVVERALALPSATAALLNTPGATACYFDTETTGLSTAAGTLLFLGGAARLDGSSLVVTQYLLPDQPHERALLGVLVGALAVAGRLVSYNGRSFDVPLLAGRLAFHGIDRCLQELPSRHDDLLPDARRLWRRPLGSARLGEIETAVLGIRRTSDCPSAEIPGRYLSYLRGASPSVLVSVVDHNAQDVVSLALLDARLRELADGGWRSAHGFDRRGMARQLLRHDRVDDALELLERALDESTDEADAVGYRRLAARTLLAAGDPDRAEAVWRAGTRRASAGAAMAWIEIARIRERWRDDITGALEAANAASRVLDLALALGRGGTLSELGAARMRVESRRRRLAGRLRAGDRRGGRPPASARTAAVTAAA